MTVKGEVTNKKRVATLYRVSTKGQLDGKDLPSQRRSCQEFIDRQEGWELVEEHIEKGISGYKIEIDKREELNKIKQSAEEGKFDILLVFMFDRLGRRELEIPILLNWFDNNGIEVWSVKEGQQKFDDEMDSLSLMFRSWVSNSESRKTSKRVDEKHSQMVEDGIYRGGTVPYGYSTFGSGNVNKKGKELLRIEIDAEKSEVIKKIYDLVLEEGYGQNRIAQYLNDNDVLSKTGRKWSSSAVNNVLRNPMYKGYMVYARGKEKEITSKKQIEELVIIENVKWDKVQSIREKRSPENVKNQGEKSIVKTTKGSLLLVGLVKCGHCGNPLCTTYNKKPYKYKDGTTIAKREAKYRCSGKAQKKVDCTGQTIYSHRKVEGVVLDELYRYLDQLKTGDYTSQIENETKKSVAGEIKILNKLQKKLDDGNKQLTKLKEEVAKSLMGTSDYKQKLLSELIEIKDNEVEELKISVSEAEKVMESKKVDVIELEEVKKFIPVWREVFEDASIEKKKMMLSTMFERITVYRDKIDIDFKINITQFVGVMGSKLATVKSDNRSDELSKILSYSSAKQYV